MQGQSSPVQVKDPYTGSILMHVGSSCKTDESNKKTKKNKKKKKKKQKKKKHCNLSLSVRQLVRQLTIWFPTWEDTNQSVQS